MKNIILAIVLFLAGFLNAQMIIPLSEKTHEQKGFNNYFKDTEGFLNPFVGTWVWENATNTAKITIKLVKKEMDDCNGIIDYKEDVLAGGYKYEENGVVITDRLIFATDHYNNPNYAVILGTWLTGPGLPEIRFQITDVAKRKRLMGTFKLDSNPNSTLSIDLTGTLKLVPQKGWTSDPNKVSLPGNTFPFEMILTKQ